MFRVRELTQVKQEDIDKNKVYIVEDEDKTVVDYALRTMIEINSDDIYSALRDNNIYLLRNIALGYMILEDIK